MEILVLCLSFFISLCLGLTGIFRTGEHLSWRPSFFGCRCRVWISWFTAATVVDVPVGRMAGSRDFVGMSDSFYFGIWVFVWVTQ
ncbi:hypothetical protein Sjap_000273 [Stephania japonica]|uniref:Secreted peptide n=1 Tax=Stephania japonica TaxID=461633 RepID=A0AAP0KJB0_9MAGN